MEKIGGYHKDCQICLCSGWVIPENGFGSAAALRCDCMGGPKKLAESIRTAEFRPDSVLAERIEKSWDGVSAWRYRKS